MAHSTVFDICYIFEFILPLFVLFLQARSLLYQFRLLPRIPCSLHDLCKLCGPGMWDSRYIPTVECSGEHPDSQSCPYGGTSTPQPSSPSPSSTPSPSPNTTTTPPPLGKKGSKTRDIFTFRKQSWGGGAGELCWSWLVLAQQIFGSICWIPELFAAPPPPQLLVSLLLRTFVTRSFHVVRCGALPYQNVIYNVWHHVTLRWGRFWSCTSQNTRGCFPLRAERTITRRRVGLELLQVQVCCWLGILPQALWAGVTSGSEATSLSSCRLWPAGQTKLEIHSQDLNLNLEKKNCSCVLTMEYLCEYQITCAYLKSEQDIFNIKTQTLCVNKDK